MKARINKTGAERYGVPEGTVIEFDEVNQFGCAKVTRVHWKSPTAYGHTLHNISVYPFSDCGDETADLLED